MVEHALFVHHNRPTGSVAAVLMAYAIMGTRLEEARGDIVFGSRVLSIEKTTGSCPYLGHHNCLAHKLAASIIIIASVIDYITEGIEVRTSPQKHAS